MNDFVLEDFRISKGKNSMIFIQTNTQTNCLYKKTAEKLRDWLDEALKQRFYITEDELEVRVRDKELPTNAGLHITIAIFYKKLTPFKAKEEAELLCERLNLEMK